MTGAGQSIASHARALTYPDLISLPMSCAASPMPLAAGRPKVRLGLDVRGLPKTQGLVAGFGPREAVLVIAVADHSRAALAGLRSGDILLSANGQALLDPAMLEDAVQAAAPGAPLVLQVWRDGQGLEKRLLMDQPAGIEGAKP